MWCTKTHPVVEYFEGQRYRGNWKVEFEHPIAAAIKKGSKFFSVEGKISHRIRTKAEISLKGENQQKPIPCGTIVDPDIAKLLKHATPSSFGRGDDTVYDEDVRKGREICSDKLDITTKWYKLYLELVKNCLFPNAKDVRFVFSKLAIYEAGGHFDVHRDTVHSHDHQGTLLIEVKSPHTGGDLVLEHNGEEIRWSLASEEGDNGLGSEKHIWLGYGDYSYIVKYIAFYTDVRHRVEPVLSGVRMVAQYDIYVSDTEPSKKRKHEEEELNENFFETATAFSPSYFSNEFPTELSQLLEQHVHDDKSISIPMFHLYTDNSLHPNRFKAIDHRLFVTLLNLGYFVQVMPVVITAISDYEGSWSDPRDGEYRVQSLPIEGGGYVLEDGEIVSFSPANQSTQKVTYIATGYEQVKFLHEKGYIEHTGNEAAPTEFRYFQSVFVVHKKKEEVAVETKPEAEAKTEG